MGLGLGHCGFHVLLLSRDLPYAAFPSPGQSRELTSITPLTLASPYSQVFTTSHQSSQPVTGYISAWLCLTCKLIRIPLFDTLGAKDQNWSSQQGWILATALGPTGCNSLLWALVFPISKTKRTRIFLYKGPFGSKF